MTVTPHHLNTGEGPAGHDPYPGGGHQDDPPDYYADGGVIFRDGEVIALAKDRVMALFIVAVLRRFAGDRKYSDDADNPGPGIGGA